MGRSFRIATAALRSWLAQRVLACDFKCRLRIPSFNVSDGTEKGQLGLREFMGSGP